MSRRFSILYEQINFLPVCVVCTAQSGDKLFPVEKTFIFGRRAVPITVKVPMCPDHFTLASARSTAQKWVESAGVVLGVLIGLGFAAGLIAYWSASGQEIFIFTIILALFLGAGFFLIVWIATVSWFAPNFSAPATIAVRSAVKLTKFWPNDEVLELEFNDDRTANNFIRANLAVLRGLKTYRLSAGLLCHDVRLNTTIKTTVKFDRPPTEDEALHLLWPVGEAEVARNFCENCPFELRAINVEEISS